MTIEAWQIIAIVFAAIINAVAIVVAPSLQEVVKYRMSQPAASPTENTPKTRGQRIGGTFKERLKFLWPQYLTIVFNLAVLVMMASDAAPLNKLTVYLVAFSFAGFLFSVVCILIVRVWFTLAEWSYGTAEASPPQLPENRKEDGPEKPVPEKESQEP